MSNDLVVGTAVLDRRPPSEATDHRLPNIEFLHIVCQCGNGKRLHCDIPVYPSGGVKTLEHQWQYEIQGAKLRVTPSVNWVGVFHNSGEWYVDFVEYDPNEGSPRIQLKRLNGIN